MLGFVGDFGFEGDFGADVDGCCSSSWLKIGNRFEHPTSVCLLSVEVTLVFHSDFRVHLKNKRKPWRSKVTQNNFRRGQLPRKLSASKPPLK